MYRQLRTFFLNASRYTHAKLTRYWIVVFVLNVSIQSIEDKKNESISSDIWVFLFSDKDESR